MGLSLPTLETGGRPFYYLWHYLRKECIWHDKKLDPHVGQPTWQFWDSGG